MTFNKSIDTIDIHNFEFLGRVFAKNIINKSPTERTPGVKGCCIKFNDNEIFVGNTKNLTYEIKDLKLNIDERTIEDRLHQLRNDIVKIIKLSAKYGIKSTLIEFSIYDQQDITCEQFYGYLIATNLDHISRYKNELQRNMSHYKSPKDSPRGTIVPCDELYCFSHFYVEENLKYNKTISEVNIENLHIFIGDYSKNIYPVRNIDTAVKNDKSLGEPLIKKYTQSFLKKVLTNIVPIQRESIDYDSKNINGGKNPEESMIRIAIPIIRPVGLNGTLNNQKQILNHYKGGCLFVFGKKDKNFDSNKFVLDIKTQCLDKAMMRSAIPAYEYDINSKKRAVSTFSHEIKHIFTALQNRWILEPDTLFEVSYCDPPIPEQSEYLGRIEVWRKDLFEEIRIIPIIFYIETIKKLVFFWTGQYNPTDLPFDIKKISCQNELNLSDLIHECWNFSKNIMAMSILFQDSIDNPNSIVEIRESHNMIVKLYDEIKIDNLLDSENKLIFDLKEENSCKKVMTLARIFQAIFLNTIKHFDPSIGCRLTLDKNDRDEIIISINNSAWSNLLDEMAERVEQQKCGIYSRNDINKWLAQIRISKDIVKNITGITHTKEVTEYLASQINGKLKTKFDTIEYTTTLTFRI